MTIYSLQKIYATLLLVAEGVALVSCATAAAATAEDAERMDPDSCNNDEGAALQSLHSSLSSSSVCPEMSMEPSTSVPIIDISALSPDGVEDDEEVRRVASLIGRACEDTGFFAVINHGVPHEVLSDAWDVTTEFFDLSPDEKSAVSPSPDGFGYPYGYEASESLSRGKERQREGTTIANQEEASNRSMPPPDLKETFSLGPEDPDKSGMPERRFPARPAGLRPAYEEYYRAMEGLAARLLRAFAVALNLKEDWFEDKMDRHMCALRVLNYPDLDGDKEPLEGQLRAGAHTDYGALTILKSGGPGLQLRKDDGAGAEEEEGSGSGNSERRWVDVPYLPEAFVINLGDLMQRWTNDKWKSTLHRVLLPPLNSTSNRRQSMAFFVNINGDATVETIESCVDRAHPRKYATIAALDHLKSKHLASMGIVEDDDGDGGVGGAQG